MSAVLPVIDHSPAAAVRDPALLLQDGRFHCFHTTAVPDGDRFQLYLDVCESTDLATWSPSRRLCTSPLNFSSPGNVLRRGGRWMLCLQSYPIPPGQTWGGEDSRLWLMDSGDLRTWSAPRLLQPAGCQVRWTASRRQIDPYLVEHAGATWCLYKTAGQFGLLASRDLQHWAEVEPDRPVLGAADTPDGAPVENPCVVRTDAGGFALFFSPCRPGRGIGLAYSDDLRHWRDCHYLDFPAVPWAGGGPTAAMVLDLRRERGAWLMAFHGEQTGVGQHAHSAAIGLAWSDDLEHWRLA